MTRYKKEDTTYVYSRSEDRSFWARTSATLQKYKLLAWIVGLIAVSAGFGFRTPQQAFADIQIQLDTVRAHERHATAERTDLQIKMDALLRLQCVRARTKAEVEEIRISGITCGR